jgi:DNA polymerase III subunit gamma/tau
MNAPAPLNLARKWRSANFDTIIGQELVIRLLKNSLYVGQLFPVYLFCGQHGCGKTTTARVFAAAVNCEQIPQFRKSPKEQIIPCGICRSCKAMQEGTHPDFIEIDAASHTGVDNVRQIIEASSLLPILGTKKIYLIDEAHMLSKAAFNALLKVLEEPPETVLFMLATTDPQKVIDTVRSRCFQLFFTAVEFETLVQHLVKICTEEAISFERAALELIVTESGGSVRDAINILETVRFSEPTVSTAAVQKTLGRLAEHEMHAIAATVLYETPQQLLPLLETINISTFSAEKIYESLLSLFRKLLWAKYGVATYLKNPEYAELISRTSVQRLTTILQQLCDQELSFYRTTKKHLFLELVLLKLCAQEPVESLPVGGRPISTQKMVPRVTTQHNGRNNQAANSLRQEQSQPDLASMKPEVQIGDGQEQVTSQEAMVQANAVAVMQSAEVASADDAVRWQSYREEISGLSDPLLQSIFVQGNFISCEESQVNVEFPAQLLFFEEWLKDTRVIWLPILQKYFGADAQLKMIFNADIVPVKTGAVKTVLPEIRSPVTHEQPVRPKTVEAAPQRPSFARRPARFNKKPLVQEGKPIDVSNTQVWQKTNLILTYFPGTALTLS